MKIRITIEAINDDGEVINSQAGEADSEHTVSDINQWCMETYTAVKMAAIFKGNKQHG